jgi:hypothetical protein
MFVQPFDDGRLHEEAATTATADLRRRAATEDTSAFLPGQLDAAQHLVAMTARDQGPLIRVRLQRIADSGTASFTTDQLGAGNHSITAVYAGDTDFNASTSAALSQAVNRAGTVISLTSSLNPSTFGQQVTFTATVSPSQGSAIPTGAVTFEEGSTVLGSVSLDGFGTASFTTNQLGGGSHAITAVYNGDTNFKASTSDALTQTVNKADTFISLMTSSNPAQAGTPVTFTAYVGSSAPTLPTGTVQFWEVDPVTGANIALLGTATLDTSGYFSLATFTTSSLSTGTHRIKALYLGDANFNSSWTTLDQTITDPFPPPPPPPPPPPGP